MSKGQNSRNNTKKKPAKTMKEKRAAKREKKNEKISHGLLTQDRSWDSTGGSNT